MPVFAGQEVAFPLTARPRHPIPEQHVEVVFTKGEAAVYFALWKVAQPYAKPPDHFRDVRIGYVRLARLARMAVSNCRVNLEGLARKLAIQVWPAAAPGGSCGYRIFGLAMLYRRLAAEGYTHYIKIGPGVRLWKPDMPDSAMPDSSIIDMGAVESVDPA